MGHAILINDVECAQDDDNCISENDSVITRKGEQQSVDISSYLLQKINKIGLIVSSDASRLTKLIHNIRVKFKSPNLPALHVIYSKSLRERDFGLLCGSRYSLNSDLFRHTRICAENGESVAQCRDRIMSFIKNICDKDYHKVLIASHPFACQIATNSMLSKSHTIITSFWLKKGSFILFEFKLGKYGLTWKFRKAYNALDNIQYSEKEIYSKLLGTEGA